MSQTYYKAINWNAIEDVIDKSTWEKLTEQFWLDTRIPTTWMTGANYLLLKKTWWARSSVA